MLVVVEYRDVETRLERLFDHEALGRGDILEVDAAEGRRDRGHGFDERLHRRRVDLDVEHVDAGETCLNSTPLPSSTGLAASAPRLPSPRIAVPLLMTATRLPLLV